MFKVKLLSIVSLSLFISLIVSCGYKVQRGSLVDSVKIESIVNQTFEHGLEDKFVVALTEELAKNSIRVDNTSPYSIEGVIDFFELRGVAQKGDVTVQFEVFIKGNFSLKGLQAPDLPLNGTMIFPVTFSSEGTLEEITALKEQAIERALMELSTEIVSSILYR